MITSLYTKQIITSILSIVFFTVFGINQLSSQITATGSFHSEFANYGGIPSDNMIFYFRDIVTLRCEVPENIVKYTWAKYNAENKTWNDISVSQEIIISEQGGYRVIADSDISKTFYCWLFTPKLVENKEINIAGDCIDLYLTSKFDSIPLIYYNPENHQPNYVKYERIYNWSASTGGEIADTRQSIRIPAPYENTTYSVTVTDKFNNTFSAVSYEYEAIAVLALFRAEILKADIPHEIKELDNKKYSSPVEIRFTDESKGYITNYIWKLGSTGNDNRPNTFYVFTEARLDTISLTVINNNSDFKCEDVNDSLQITIMESMLEFPNAFTPNGDGINDEFRPVYSSLKKYKITIVNRYGRVVYTSTNPAKGWDGNFGDKPAPPGVYYFYAEAEGYKKGETHKKTGAVHLIRGKK